MSFALGYNYQVLCFHVGSLLLAKLRTQWAAPRQLDSGELELKISTEAALTSMAARASGGGSYWFHLAGLPLPEASG